MRLKPIAQQVVVLMGASSGMGRETARRFAQRGARVVVSARSEPGLRSLVDEIQAAGGKAIAVPADVSDFDQVKSVADRAAEVYGRIDTWVHLASVGMWATFEQTTPAEFKRIIDVNLTGQAYGAMAALPHLRREGGGALIHISSIEAKLPVPLQSAYGASKQGMTGLIDTLRMELEAEGANVSVTNVMPSGINTPFFNKARTKIGVQPKPVPPIYQPQLVADAILYAAEHPVREIVVGGGGKAGIVLKQIAPWVSDALLRSTAFQMQRTNIAKSADAPDNLFEPIAGYDRVEGDYSERARSTSGYTWLALHPNVRRVAVGIAVAAVAIMAIRPSQNGYDAHQHRRLP